LKDDDDDDDDDINSIQSSGFFKLCTFLFELLNISGLKMYENKLLKKTPVLRGRKWQEAGEY
jgi:hypothetical protein